MTYLRYTPSVSVPKQIVVSSAQQAIATITGETVTALRPLSATEERLIQGYIAEIAD